MVEKTKKYLIHPATKLGAVHYTVAGLEPQLEFYQRVLGLQVHWQEKDRAGLGTGGDDLLLLTEAPGARRVPRTTGAYHFALLLPDRRELARAIGRLFQIRYPNYPTDHVVSKTTYLDDPEGNNIELYVYSQEDGTITLENGSMRVWHADGRPSNGREPLDLEALFRHLEAGDPLDAPLPSETIMGHVHLYGSNMDASMHFYSEVLGFKKGGIASDIGFGDVTLDRPHVIAFNTWYGEGALPPPPDSLGLRYFSILLPNKAELDKVVDRIEQADLGLEQHHDGLMVKDPSGISVLLSTQSAQELRQRNSASLEN